MRRYLGYIVVMLVIILLIPIINDVIYHTYSARNISYNCDNWDYKTGDILLFTWLNDSLFNKTNGSFINMAKFNKSYHNSIVPNLFNMLFTHVGVVIIYNNRPCIYELNENDSYLINKDYNKQIPKFCQFKKKHVFDHTATLIDINYLKYYAGHVYKVPYIGPEISKRVIEYTLIANKNNKNVTVESIINKCILSNKSYPSYLMSCSSFILHALDSLNIIKVNNKDCYLPCNVLDLCVNSGKYDISRMAFTNNGY